MKHHCHKRRQYNESINSEKQELEGLLWQFVIFQLRQCDRVEQNDPHDVDEQDYCECGVSESF